MFILFKAMQRIVTFSLACALLGLSLLSPLSALPGDGFGRVAAQNPAPPRREDPPVIPPVQPNPLPGGRESSTLAVARFDKAGLAFGDQQINATGAPQQITFSNAGAGPLNIVGMATTGPNASEFTVTNTCGASVAVRASCTITVSFRPQATGPRTGTLVVTTNATGSPHMLSLTGNGAPLPDTTPPAAPAGLMAMPGNAKVTLSWMANTEADLAGYNLYRDTSMPVSTTGTPVNGATLLPKAATSYEDTGRTNGTTYSYVLQAVDTAANKSAVSATAMATPQAPDTTAPAAPTGVMATAGNASVTVSWAANTEADLRGYNVYRGATATVVTTGTPLTGATPLTGTTYTDTGLTNGTMYYYVVVAVDNVGNTSAASSPAASATPQAPQAMVSLAPTSLTFAGQQTGTTSPAQAITLTNNGTAPLTLTSIAVTGANMGDFAPTNTCGTSVAAMMSCTISVTFTPVATGTRTAALTITDSAAGSPRTVMLTGTGTAPPDTTAPAAPTGVMATAGNASVTVSWMANTEADLAGYNVFRGTTMTVVTTGTPLNGATLLTMPTYTDTTAMNGTTYYYVVMAKDMAGNTSAAASPAASATPSAPPTTVNTKVNFQSPNAPVPTGYVRDYGQPYGVRTGANQSTGLTYGWVVPDTTMPRDLSVGGSTPGNGRERMTAQPDQRLETFVHMQYNNVANNTNGTPQPGSWEIAVPNGTYTVTVAVGEPSVGMDMEFHTIFVEGTLVINRFQPTGTEGANTRHTTGTATVTVTDGRLTLAAQQGTNAANGFNTKINYVDIATAAPDTMAPAAPTGVMATAGDAQVTLAWAANAEADLAGYNVFRGTTSTVATTGTPLNGATPLPKTVMPTYTDTGLTNGTMYYYVVVAVDNAGNTSAASSPAVSATPQAAPTVGAKINFQPDAAPVPPGYTKDTGAGFDATRGYGWVRQDSLGSAPMPLDLTTNTRDRNRTPPVAQELDTIIHMQYGDIQPPGTTGNRTPGAWEYVIPNGRYRVTVSVGDQPGNGSVYDSLHTVTVENTNAIYRYQATAAAEYRQATVVVQVADGKLTLDALGGTNTKLNSVEIASTTDALTGRQPYATGITPADTATDVKIDAGILVTIRLPNGTGINASTLNDTNVKLTRDGDTAGIPANPITSGGGDVISLKPMSNFAPNTKYRLTLTTALQDASGAAFLPFSSTFTTGTGCDSCSGGGTTAAFDKTNTNAPEAAYTSVTVGPDHRLYASTLSGEIYRFPINADGSLGSPTTINTVRAANGNTGRTVIGLTFDPAATPSNLILWITDNVQFTGPQVADWSGKIAKLTGPDLENYQLVVTNLPRSIRDHETNSIAFKPGEPNFLYVAQGSNNAMGAPDSAWGNRPERLLNAAVLRLDLTKLPATLPLDAKTEEGGTYNPFAANAPLTIYASGIRNAYDLVWHSNGRLYAPTNGSASGGNTPATTNPLPAACENRRVDGTPYTGPQVPAITSNPQTETDYIFNVSQGRYYGHPNPARCEWVLNNGNPTAGDDPIQVNAYPVGTQPDRNYDLAGTYDHGRNASPNGTIEYKGNAFGGSLNGKLIVIRYSQVRDIVVVSPTGTNGNVTGDKIIGIAGFTGYSDPLDITQDSVTGFLYVAENATGKKIWLLKPQGSTGGGGGTTATANKERLVYNQPTGGGASAAQPVTITNTGANPLTVSGVTITGADAASFAQTNTCTSVPANGTCTVNVTFDPAATGPKDAMVQVASNAAGSPLSVTLRGLGTLGQGGSNEPSLQWILDTYQIPVNVGDPDPTNNALPTTKPLGPDQVTTARFVAANSANPVTMEVLAVFGPTSPEPTLRAGWYSAGNASGTTQLFTVANASGQSLNPVVTGSTSFSPGTAAFGFYSQWPAFSERKVYTEDALNTFSGAIPHHVRVYPLKNPDGTIVPKAFILATEETTSGFDYQDIVVILRNVVAAPTAASNAHVELSNLDGVPFADRLAFSRIQTPADANQKVHDTATLRIRNTGTDPLQITALTFGGPWQTVNPVTLPQTVAVNTNFDLPIRFTATSGNVVNGTLTIASNANNGPNTVVQLSGFWQSVSEGGQEPDVREISQVMGYTTVITASGQNLNGNGRLVAVGDEVLSPYWQRVNSAQAVTVRQLAAYHSYPASATVKWHVKGSTTTTTIFTHDASNGQSLLPTKNNGAAQGSGTFTPSTATTVFGFQIDGEWSDNTRNNQSADNANGCPVTTPATCGHHVRFWPVKDRAGMVIPGMYLMAMDYSGINYDYNDNVYLVTNIAPDAPAAPTNVVATAGDAQVTLTWNANTEPDLRGYNVFRGTTTPVSTSGTPLNGATPLTMPMYTNTGLTNGTVYYYVVQAVDNATPNSKSAPSVTVSAVPRAAGTFATSVNFQSPNAPVPSGYARDFGQAYGARTDANQGTGLTYGWVTPGTNTPRDLSQGGTTPGNGRDREVESDQRLDTFMHMQYDDVMNPTNGTALEGAWEIAVPNGTYRVTVAVGDPQSGADPEFHTLNVEGTNAINRFEPMGANGSGTRHSIATVTVTVADGRLTLDATGGTNTKTCYLDLIAQA